MTIKKVLFFFSIFLISYFNNVNSQEDYLFKDVFSKDLDRADFLDKSMSFLFIDEYKKNYNYDNFLKVKSNIVIAYQVCDSFGVSVLRETARNVEKYKNGKCIEWSTPISNRIFKYDKNNNLVEDSYYDSLGKILSKNMYKYNKLNKVLENAEYSDDGSLREKIIYNYNEKGNILSQINYSSKGNITQQILYEYNDYGNVVKEEKNNGKGEITDGFFYKYNDRNKVIELVYYQNQELLKFKATYVYNEKENIDSITITEYESNCVGTFKIEDNMLSQVIYNYGDQNIGNRLYKYEAGRISEVISSDYEGKIEQITTYIYDSNGNEIEESNIVFKGAVENKTTSKKEFDKYNNWIKSKKFNNNIPIEVIERRIEYF